MAAGTQPKGANAPRLAGRESGQKSGAAEQARDFFLPLCFLVGEERGFRAPLKGAPETGASRGYQRGPQRRARAAVISADPRDGHGMLRLLLPPPRSLCASTGHYPHRPPRSLCSPPLPGSRDPGTTSPGEGTAHLRLLQHHAGLCCCRLTPHPYPSLPLA